MKTFICLTIAILVAVSTYPVYAQNVVAAPQPNIIQLNGDLLTFVGAFLTCLTLSFALLTKYIITPVVKREFEEWGKLHITKEIWELENKHIWEAIGKKRHG